MSRRGRNGRQSHQHPSARPRTGSPAPDRSGGPSRPGGALPGGAWAPGNGPGPALPPGGSLVPPAGHGRPAPSALPPAAGEAANGAAGGAAPGVAWGAANGAATTSAVPPVATGPAGPPTPSVAAPARRDAPEPPGPGSAPAGTAWREAEPPRASCTVAQLRRFIKSRPWVPMHELRRRFGIVGVDDDVTPVRVGDQVLFIGLPAAEGRLMGELLAGGDVGYELSLDPDVPVVVGVYPMRPVPRT